VALIGKRRDAYRVLMGKLEGKGLVENPRHRWKDVMYDSQINRLGRDKMDGSGSGWGNESRCSERDKGPGLYKFGKFFERRMTVLSHKERHRSLQLTI
jgi:hypothetical protein